jgi:hypothetical protein
MLKKQKNEVIASLFKNYFAGETTFIVLLINGSSNFKALFVCASAFELLKKLADG